MKLTAKQVRSVIAESLNSPKLPHVAIVPPDVYESEAAVMREVAPKRKPKPRRARGRRK